MHLPDSKIGEMMNLEWMIKGSKRDYAKLKPGIHEQLPITTELLLMMSKIWKRESNNFDNIMPWAASCSCFYIFLVCWCLGYVWADFSRVVAQAINDWSQSREFRLRLRLRLRGAWALMQQQVASVPLPNTETYRVVFMHAVSYLCRS